MGFTPRNAPEARSEGEKGPSLEALLTPMIKSILVKGRPGTGKTTLTLELLKMSKGGLYISTRNPERKIALQHPDIEPLLRSGALVEYQTLEAREREKATTGEVIFEDLRLGAARDVVERVLIAAHQLRLPLIVLDSWDALAKEMERKERLRVEKSLTATIDASDSRIIFVSEEPELTTTDYLVDAIVELHDLELEGRRLRRLDWVKLRGSGIPRKSSLFTLHNGRFTLLQETSVLPSKDLDIKPFQPIAHALSHYSSGSSELDSFLGDALRKGSVIGIELSPKMGRLSILPWMSTFFCNFLAQGGCSVGIPNIAIPPTLLREHLSSFLGQDTLAKHLRLGHLGGYPKDPMFFRLEIGNVDKSLEILRNKINEAKEGEEKACLVFLGLDALEFAFEQSDALHFLLRVLELIREKEDALLLALAPGSRIREQVINLADVYIKLAQLYGTFIIYSEVPPSRLMAVNFDYSQGYLRIGLKPIV